MANNGWSPVQAFNLNLNLPPNAVPVANAGADQTVTAGNTVTLDGSNSLEPDGSSLTYSWTLTQKPSGSAAALANSTSANPSFTPDLGGSYIASLVVNDGAINSPADTVLIVAQSSASATTGPKVAGGNLSHACHDGRWDGVGVGI